MIAAGHYVRLKRVLATTGLRPYLQKGLIGVVDRASRFTPTSISLVCFGPNGELGADWTYIKDDALEVVTDPVEIAAAKLVQGI